MRFPARKNAGCPKAPRNFPPRKDGILHPPRPVALGLPPHPPESVRAYGRAMTSQPKFIESIAYQICLAMVSRRRTSPAGLRYKLSWLMRVVNKCLRLHFLHAFIKIEYTTKVASRENRRRFRTPLKDPLTTSEEWPQNVIVMT